ncbi:Helix-turn-helix domain protein [Vibrio aerogenes CECT 7868]|uniref:Helix-turn-helix domain protein n=1 Tax=Vibrio aerogenes CECT 7868 TaxID=1216006 RepID=A0A1M5ZJ22_9VIBR|nr:helix-turn-helix domain-containing protein [Vibrio aerogenes]SHI24212.1 Helix-turn-helix domain protein [Vibrio aerogenes CECT 7868]
MRHIGDRLRETMRMRGISATQLARELNLGKGHISNIMTGRIQSPKKHLPAIADYLQVSQSWLLTGEGSYEELPVAVFPVYEMKAGMKQQAGMCKVPGMFSSDENFGVISDSLPRHCLVIVSSENTGDGLYLVEDDQHRLVIASRNDLVTRLEWSYLSATEPHQPSVIGKIEMIIDKETYIYET